MVEERSDNDDMAFGVLHLLRMFLKTNMIQSVTIAKCIHLSIILMSHPLNTK
jgi:hypothetical protein